MRVEDRSQETGGRSQEAGAGRLLGPRGVVAEFFPGRSTRWVKEKAKLGEFGKVWLDGGGYLISEGGILDYLRRNELNLDSPIPRGRRENLVNA